ncbi:MAG: CHASE2 domain-containing protein [Pseudomonadota bacterium]
MSDSSRRLRGLLARAGLVLAVLFAGVATVAVERMPERFGLQLVTPAWMPQQIAKLVEFANDVQVAFVVDRAPAEHGTLALVLVREQTLEDLPYLSPIDRGLMARLVRAVDAMGPRVIGLDFVFDQATEPAKDRALESAIAQARARVVLGGIDERTPLSDRRRTWQRAFLARTGRPAGYFNLRYDAQEASGQPIIRYRAGPSADPQFPLSFAEAVASAAEVAPWSPGASRRIAWLGKPENGGETFLAIEAGAVLAAAAEPSGPLATVLRTRLSGKIVVVGADFPDRDRHPTPMTLFDDTGMAGVEVHAHILAALLDRRRLDDLDAPWRPVLMFLAAGLGFLAGWLARASPGGLAVAGLVGMMLVGGVSMAMLWQLRTIVPIGTVAALFFAGVIGGRLVGRFASRPGR